MMGIAIDSMMAAGGENRQAIDGGRGGVVGDVDMDTMQYGAVAWNHQSSCEMYALLLLSIIDATWRIF